MKRIGQVIRVRPEKLQEYKRLHANAWPEVLATIKKANIRNFSIFHRDGLLFSYFEYVGDDYEADMAMIAADPKTQEWWRHTDPCQQPVDSAAEDQWWAPTEEVFHTD